MHGIDNILFCVMYVLICRESCLDIQHWNVVCKFCEEAIN